MIRKTLILIVLILADLYSQTESTLPKCLHPYNPVISYTPMPQQTNFDVLHYEFDLTFPFESSAFYGTVKLTCQSLAAIRQMSLQMGDLVADSIGLDGNSVSFTHSGEQLLLEFSRDIAENDRFTLEIHYHGSPDERGFLFYDRCAYTMAEPEDARYWFPCHDVPWDKATAGLKITVPAGIEVASIGLLQYRTVSEDSMETFYWATEYPVATYLICVTMSDEYIIWTDWAVDATGDSIKMPYYIVPEDSLKSRNDVKNLPEALWFFSDRFGPYPFEKYGTATVTQAWFGGMEHQTMTTVIQRWWQGNRAYEWGFVHELAHTWWGDAVTLQDWPDIWLNEGFATYSEMLFHEKFYGRESFHSVMQDRKKVYLDQTATMDFPVYDPPRDQLFNWGIVYIKGSWVLHMLRRVIGETRFWTLLRTYYNTYRYENASTTDFQQVCEQIYGQSLDWFFDEWIYHAGYPSLTYSWKNEYQADDRFTARVFIHQDSPFFQMPVDLRIQYAGSLLDTTVWIRNFREEFDLALPDSVQNIELDPDGWVLMADSLEASPVLPDTGVVWLNAGYPNPFHETIRFEYYIPHKSADGRISIYNLRGQLIALLAEYMEAGWHRIEWNGRDAAGQQMASGLYIFDLEASGTHLVRRALLIR
jgi:aminopeptidase N